MEQFTLLSGSNCNSHVFYIILFLHSANVFYVYFELDTEIQMYTYRIAVLKEFSVKRQVRIQKLQNNVLNSIIVFFKQTEMEYSTQSLKSGQKKLH